MCHSTRPQIACGKENEAINGKGIGTVKEKSCFTSTGFSLQQELVQTLRWF